MALAMISFSWAPESSPRRAAAAVSGSETSRAEDSRSRRPRPNPTPLLGHPGGRAPMSFFLPVAGLGGPGRHQGPGRPVIFSKR